MAKTKTEEKKPETFQITWSNIPISINYIKNYWQTCKVSHLEVRADEPLPITETGYRSIWLMPGELEGTNPIDYVLEGLEELSRSKKWKSYLQNKKREERAKSQLSLF